MNKQLLFIDTETGGLNPEIHSLLSLALAAWDSNSGLIDTCEIYFNHDKYSITNKATEINKINESNISYMDNFISPDHAIKEIEWFCKKNFLEPNSIVIAGHNVAFDISFLKKLYSNQRSNYNARFSHRFVDTHSIMYYLQMVNRLPEYLKLDSSNAFDYFGLHVKNRHTALGDALATVKLFEALLSLQY